jgi:hypothetical protein
MKRYFVQYFNNITENQKPERDYVYSTKELSKEEYTIYRTSGDYYKIYEFDTEKLTILQIHDGIKHFVEYPREKHLKTFNRDLTSLVDDAKEQNVTLDFRLLKRQMKGKTKRKPRDKN